ncbi:MAG: hypothetical protein K4571_01740 [Deltaproteobacteria bacterium]
MRKVYAAIMICILVFVTAVYAAETQMTAEDIIDTGSMISNALTSGQILFGFF